MKRYCFDTSGLTTALEGMPQDIHISLWTQISSLVVGGQIAVTEEIYKEMTHIQGNFGECIRSNANNLVLELGDAAWDFSNYLNHAKRMQTTYAKFIRENVGGKKATIGTNDLSIVALGKSLALPVVSMEKPKAHQSETRRGIPDICTAEQIPHMTFNDFLRAEGIKL